METIIESSTTENILNIWFYLNPLFLTLSSWKENQTYIIEIQHSNSISICMILHVSNKSELITVSFMKMLSIIFNDLNLKMKYINIYFNSWVTYISGFFFSFQPFSKVRHSPSLYLQMFKAMSITSASSSGNALITRCLTNKKRCLQNHSHFFLYLQ